MAREPEEVAFGTFRMEGPTPHGGDYSLAIYKDQDGATCRKEVAVAVDILEMTDAGRCTQVIHGYLRPPEETGNDEGNAASGWRL